MAKNKRRAKLIRALEKAHGKNWRRKINRRAFKEIFPPAIEQQLERRLLRIVFTLNNEKNQRLNEVLNKIKKLKEDEATTIDRTKLLEETEKVYKAVERQTTGQNTKLKRSVMAVGKTLQNQMQKHNEKVFFQGLKVSIDFDTDPTYKKVKFFTQNTADSITGVNSREKTQIARAIQDGFVGGFNKDRMAKEIDRILNGDDKTQPFAEWQIKRIATNEMLTLQGTIQKEHMTEVGITQYIWRTVGDGSVRPTHQDLDGKKRTFGDGLEPSQEINCRCFAEPVIPDD